MSLFLKGTRLQSITGDPFSSEKSSGSLVSLSFGLCMMLALLKKNYNKIKNKKEILTNKSTAGLVNSAGSGHTLTLHVSTSKLRALSSSTPSL